MKKNKSRPFKLLIAVLLLGNFTQAQESSNSSGGNATGNGGNVSFSIGQVLYTENSGNSGSISQGVQHTYEIYTVSINETNLDISLTAFPNPTTENLTLQINDFKNEKLIYQLFDIQGKLIYNGQIIEKQTKINTANLPNASYFIHIVNQENKKVQSFQIIKN